MGRFTAPTGRSPARRYRAGVVSVARPLVPLRVVSVLVVLIGAVLGVGAAQAAAPVRVTVRPVAPAFAASDPVRVHVTFTNRGQRAVRLPATAVPTAVLRAPLFAVGHAGGPVAYTGPLAKLAPTAERATVVLAPGASLTRVVDLADAYAFTRSGTYTIRFTAGGLRSNAVVLEVARRPARVVVPGVRAGAFTSCTAEQQTTAATALTDATTYVGKAKSYLDAGVPGLRYTTWFGAYDGGRWTAVQTHYANMATALATQTITIDCAGLPPNCDPNVYAWVAKDVPYLIHVCGGFWSAPAIGTDSKAGTLIHELSHFDVIGSTDDWAYGQENATALAITSAAQATDNADNHEYFAENNAALEAPSYTYRTATSNPATTVSFASQAVGAMSAVTPITVTNTGDQPLAVSGVAIVTDFTLQSDTCSGQVLAPAGTCTLGVAFLPTAVGARTSTITIASNAYKDLTLTLTGTATAAVEAPAPVATSAPAAASTTASAPTVRAPVAKLRGHSLAVTVSTPSFTVQLRKRGTWVPVGTFQAKDGKASVTLKKRGVYRVVAGGVPTSPVTVRR